MQESMKCPNCGYSHAVKEGDREYEGISTDCDRCGYHECKVIVGRGSPPKWIRHTFRTGGLGIYMCIYKKPEIFEGVPVKAVVSGRVVKGLIKELREQLKEIDKCIYSYKWRGKWFIKDLITNKRIPYSYKAFFGG